MDGLQGVIYIGGAARSGSTLLSVLLAQLDGVTSVGEARWLWDGERRLPPRCRRGDDIHACEVLGAGLAAAGASPGQATTLVPTAASFSSFYGAVAAKTRSRWVVDASKSPQHLGRLRRWLDADVRVVNLIRDPRAVVYSHDRKGRMHISQRSTFRQVGNWAAKATWFGVYAAGRNGRRVRYEDLAGDPGATVASLAAWLGTDGPRHRGRSLEIEPPHSIYGNGRVDHGTSRLEITPDDEWERALAASRRRWITAATAPWLLWYGYPLR